MHDRASQTVVVSEVHTVDQEPVIGAEPGQSGGGISIVDALGDMDVHADAVAQRQLSSRGQCVVGAREGSVDAHHRSPASGEEAVVLLESSTCAIGTVPVGDPVARDHPHPDLGTCLSDHTQRALDRMW